VPRIEGLRCASGTSYAVGVTAVNAKLYVDRDYTFEKEGLPPGLLGECLTAHTMFKHLYIGNTSIAAAIRCTSVVDGGSMLRTSHIAWHAPILSSHFYGVHMAQSCSSSASCALHYHSTSSVLLCRW
jgi:hypothetical protein